MLKIEGGTVYDPANGVDGEVRDLWVDGGKVVAAPVAPSANVASANGARGNAPPSSGVNPTRTIDARGLVVMPGGVDMHCHIAGPKVTAARKLRCDDRRGRDQAVERVAGLRSGTLGSVPSTFATAYKYAGLGYTTAFDAAVPPLGARQAHQELADTPCLDTGFFVLVGNNRYAMECLKAGDAQRLRAYLAWLLRKTKGFAPKIVNPGGVAAWKQRATGNVEGLDDPVPGFGVTPRQIISGVAEAANELALPHPVHLHCNQLGVPGNWSTTLDTMRALEGQRAHLSHIQFHSYGGGGTAGGDNAAEASLGSQVERLADYVNRNPNLSVDVGQVMFGATTALTGDGPLGHYLYRVTGERWLSHDTELGSGCAVLPLNYKNKNRFNALQWAAGLEWYLMVDDPWRVAMSTDSPNGASFRAYPEVVRLLMDRSYRADVLKTCPPDIARRCRLADLDREYTLAEIAIITRAGPARLLGLRDKGHLGPGADADITIYTPDANRVTMFQLPRVVLKAGVVVAEQGEVRAAPAGKRLCVQAQGEDDRLADLPAFFDRHSSVPLDDYGVSDDEVADVVSVAAG